MRTEAVDQFVKNFRKRVEEEKLKQDVERTFLEEALNFLVSYFNSNIGPSIKGVKNYRTKEISCYMDIEASDPKKLKSAFKGSLRKIDRKLTWFDLGELIVISFNIKDLQLVSGVYENHIILELYSSPVGGMTRLKISLGNKDKHCGIIHRKSMKWMTWIWEDSRLKRIILDRVDPFSEKIIFRGDFESRSYVIETELDDSGFNYEILSIKTV